MWVQIEGDPTVRATGDLDAAAADVAPPSVVDPALLRANIRRCAHGAPALTAAPALAADAQALADGCAFGPALSRTASHSGQREVLTGLFPAKVTCEVF